MHCSNQYFKHEYSPPPPSPLRCSDPGKRKHAGKEQGSFAHEIAILHTLKAAGDPKWGGGVARGGQVCAPTAFDLICCGYSLFVLLFFYFCCCLFWALFSLKKSLPGPALKCVEYLVCVFFFLPRRLSPPPSPPRDIATTV